MKKIITFILLSMLFITNVNADVGGREVVFTYTDNSFSSGIKSYTNGRTLLTVSFKSTASELTPSMLSEILSQSSNTNAGKLYVYGTVKVKVNPVSGGTYESLLDHEGVSVSISDALYIDSTSANVSKGSDIVTKPKEFNYFIPVMKVEYRKTTSDEWQANTNFTLAESRTLKSKLAELLEIDLESNTSGVENAYNDLYRFSTLGEDDTNTTRFDFYNNDTTSSITSNILGTEYLIMKYTSPTTTTALVINEESTSGNTFIKAILVTLLLGALGGTTYYLKKKNLISFD